MAGGRYKADIPADWRERTVLSVMVGGALLGLSRQASYDAAHRGDLPTLRIGRKLVVPVVPLRRLLGELAPLAEVRHEEDPMSVTANDSHSEASSVTRNGCRGCRWDDVEPHCRVCHVDAHRACLWCGACMPAGHPSTRWYCSTTCRVKASAQRRSPEEVAKREAAEQSLQALASAIRAASGGDPDQTSRERRRRVDAAPGCRRTLRCLRP
jgi:hypothetical protein